MDANSSPTENNETFTDEDLKKFKEWNSSCNPAVARLPMIAKEKALIARLEAAEKYIEETRRDCEACGEPIGETDTSMKAEEAWAKVSGRL